ncbi:hypothetical protein HNR46_002164 [Haloferula luteola]|uniref:PPi-type phosphoenolpyruvate carboxykinase lobe 2 domain-containing protein n=1 Tax=Haloferula luteola TaxID=595692 RepID=A0A840V1Q8_9BACT|nr:hypothetical protein [Haloferula luteola]MBB5351925.1 hypothetical protein [Haloferula luteola]
MKRTLQETIGYFPSESEAEAAQRRLTELANVKLASRGFAVPEQGGDSPLLSLGRSLLANFEEKLRIFGEPLCPVDQAIHDFLVRYLGDQAAGVFEADEAWLPSSALTLERHGLARVFSLPADADRLESDILSSYRVHQGVCHNPAKDRRTTEGVFHIVEDGLPIPADKKGVPRRTFARLLRAALQPPEEFLRLPYTATRPAAEQAHTFVSLLLRPMVCPEVPGVVRQRTMEIRFFAPGALVSNLDFVESIFGNAGDPSLPENDARLDAGGWTGHTGCVILAPHLTGLRKKDLGLPAFGEATERQRADGMCWENEDELYNEGGAFKIACRDASGVCVTLIADSYYGYCKKEVKTQISFAANLFGLCEEEHAGGALAFPSFDHGEDFSVAQLGSLVNHTWEEVVRRHGANMEVKPEGYGVDRRWPDIVYLPETARLDLRTQRITWQRPDGLSAERKMLAGETYVMPSGYKVEMSQSVKGQRWRLVGTQAEGTLCHKPCTVSGGGKSEISKSLADAMLAGPVTIPHFQEALRRVQEILDMGQEFFTSRFHTPRQPQLPSRPILDPSRSFGSVVRMMTPGHLFTESYNRWLEAIPRPVRGLLLILKRRYQAEWGDDWASKFSVDMIDGQPGIELKFYNQRLYTRYLRVGFSGQGAWRIFGLRKDFAPAVKLQREDDITASVVVAAEKLKGLHPKLDEPAYKFVANCEYRLFQRPDDAVIRGYDRATEADFSKKGMFFSNYEPLPRGLAQEMTEDAIRFGQFTEAAQKMIQEVSMSDVPDWFVCTANPRIVDGKPTKNPRYLQNRPDLGDPRKEYLGEMGARLYRRLEAAAPVLNPAHSVLPGRRNNPAEPEAGIRPLAVFGPIHYQELPELFMDFAASLTGKSPSTTGAGSEGALTKGPFNCLLPIHDLNNALLSMLLTRSHGFSSAAGHIGRKYRVDHDISLVVPEVWSRMHIHERDPQWLIDHGCLESVKDFEHQGRVIPGSRLGWRITQEFVSRFFGRVFNDPTAVFPVDMLRPELQSLEEFVDGIEHIAEAHQRVATNYFLDGSLEHAIPPLRALLTIMAEGSWEGKTWHDPDFRRLFEAEGLMESEWYQARLEARAVTARRLWERHVKDLSKFLERRTRLQPVERAVMEEKLHHAREQLLDLERTGAQRYRGSLGLDPGLVEGRSS